MGGGAFLALENMKQPLLLGSLLLGYHGVNVFTSLKQTIQSVWLTDSFLFIPPDSAPPFYYLQQQQGNGFAGHASPVYICECANTR